MVGYINPKLAAIRGVLAEFDRHVTSAPEEFPIERIENKAQMVLGYINKLTELEKTNGNKTRAKSRVRK
jgi:hypothetical protein